MIILVQTLATKVSSQKNNKNVIYRYFFPIITGFIPYCEDTTCPIPKEDSDVVRKEKKDLLGTLDMQTIVEDLDHVGTFIYIAYTCFVAAGPKF